MNEDLRQLKKDKLTLRHWPKDLKLILDDYKNGCGNGHGWPLQFVSTLLAAASRIAIAEQPHPFTNISKKIEIITKFLQSCPAESENCKLGRYAEEQVKIMQHDYMLERLKKENMNLREEVYALQEKLNNPNPNG